MKLFLKAFVFCAVGVLTWMATSSIVAQQQKARGKAVSPARVALAASTDPTVQTSVRTSKLKPGPAFNQIELGKSDAIAETYLRSGGISIEEGNATANAHVSMSDLRPGMSYVWRFQVVDEQENTLSGHVYDEQMFSVEEDGKKEVDFEDTIKVPAGAYRVELVLYDKPPGQDMSFLTSNETARAYQKIRMVKLISK